MSPVRQVRFTPEVPKCRQINVCANYICPCTMWAGSSLGKLEQNSKVIVAVRLTSKFLGERKVLA